MTGLVLLPVSNIHPSLKGTESKLPIFASPGSPEGMNAFTIRKMINVRKQSTKTSSIFDRKDNFLSISKILSEKYTDVTGHDQLVKNFSDHPVTPCEFSHSLTEIMPQIGLIIQYLYGADPDILFVWIRAGKTGNIHRKYVRPQTA